jgi:hypothetical protein
MAIFVTAMGSIKRVILKLLIFLFASLCIDGGRSVLSSSVNVQLLIVLDHINDTELPGHHSHSHFYDDEKLAGSPEIDFSNYSGNSVKFPFYLNPLISEFHNSIWQPPEII